MNATKIGALAVVMVLLVTSIGAFAIGYDTDTDSQYTNPTSTTYAKEYNENGLSIVTDYEDEDYTINSTTTDTTGLIVSDKAIIDFDPSETNVTIYYGNRTQSFTYDYDISATLTNCTSEGFTESSTTLSMTVTALYDAQLPSTITVTIGGTAYSGYTWSNTTGIYSMPLSAITDDVSITISATLPTTTYYDSNNNQYILYGNTLTISAGVSGTGIIPNGTSSQNVMSAIGISSNASKLIFDSTITKIGNYFAYQRSLNSVKTSAETIGDYAFSGSYLNTLILNEGVKYIGNYAFQICSISSLILPSSCVQLGDYAFIYCRLSEIVVNSGLVIIGQYAFAYTSGMTDFVMPNSVVTLKAYAFYNSAVRTITLSERITEINQYTFAYCTNLTTITIPDSVSTIGTYAFWQCTSITSIDLPDNSNFKIISTSCFRMCSALTSITIPDSVSTIQSYAFRDCSSLTSITIPNNVTSMGSYALQWCTSLTSVTLGTGIKSIPTYLFSDCTSLTSVTMNGNVTTLQSYCFQNCTSLHSITIPSTVTTWQNYVFKNCSLLYYIYMLRTTPITMSYPTTSIPTITTICVPTGTLSAYQSASGWSTISSRIVEGSPPISSSIPMGTPIEIEVPEITVASILTVSETNVSDNVNDGTIHYTYSKLAVLTSLSITYTQSKITLTSNVGTIMVPNVDTLYLINTTMTDSKYYVYSGNISNKYYVESDHMVTYSTQDYGTVVDGLTKKIGYGTVTQNADVSEKSSSVDEYPTGSTPITISGVTSQSTILQKSLAISQGEKYHTEYLIGGIALILVGLALAIAIFRKD